MPSPWSSIIQSVVLFLTWSSFTDAEVTVQNPTKLAETTQAANTCDAITINYITHSLPQSCLTSTWSSSAPASANANDEKSSTTPNSHVTSQASPRTPAPAPTPNPSDTESESPDGTSDGGTKPFMSFEDWKAMMLKETGQDPQDLGTRNANQRGTGDRTPPDMGHAGLGEEDEISLNFDSYLDDNRPAEPKGHGTVSSSDSASEHAVLDIATSDDVRPSVHRSKDAGKTCKERFSYSSFDAGATVLKAGPGAKNTKAILVENKDSYMLLECSTRPKFVIVELSDDILIDTIVLANFEFFSSMIRHFRVSVSDRYPVKTDRWRELGTFEARNSRDIQPFLIENPQIFAKHVQIEFLTHYGNEYYCPLSLLRVHGSALLDSWKDSDPGRDEELHADAEPEVPRIETQSEVAKLRDVQKASFTETVTDAPSLVEPSSSCALTAPSYLFSQQNATCDASHNLVRGDPSSHVQNRGVDSEPERGHHHAPDPAEARGTAKMHVSKTQSSTIESVATAPPTTASPTMSRSVTSSTSSLDSPSSEADVVVNSTAQVTSTKVASNPESSTIVIPVNKPSPPGGTGGKNRTSGTASSAASPPVQEGFFKAITKRLHQVESNLTLSLKYVEDQARHLQESLQRTEHKQISKVNLFLVNLNQTVLAELRTVREQYDQIWQSTVIALESQREQSQREIVALSTRLNVLADEVVFQKRMAIVQAVLLLSCLILVIFSRGVSLPYLAPFTDYGAGLPSGSAVSPRARGLYGPAFEAARHNPTLYDTREVDYIPVTLASQGLRSKPVNRHHNSLSVDEQAALLQCERLSPPPTPSLADDVSLADRARQPLDPQATSLRCPPTMQQNSVRKPLPALPENPSSP